MAGSMAEETVDLTLGSPTASGRAAKRQRVELVDLTLAEDTGMFSEGLDSRQTVQAEASKANWRLVASSSQAIAPPPHHYRRPHLLGAKGRLPRRAAAYEAALPLAATAEDGATRCHFHCDGGHS